MAVAVMPFKGQVNLDNQPLALTAACLQAVLHMSQDTSAVSADQVWQALSDIRLFGLNVGDVDKRPLVRRHLECRLRLRCRSLDRVRAEADPERLLAPDAIGGKRPVVAVR